MFYRLRRSLNYFRFYHQTKRLLDTPPIRQQAAPLTIVSMVAGHDVHMYILAVKSLYRRLGRGRIAMVSDGVLEIMGSVSLAEKEQRLLDAVQQTRLEATELWQVLGLEQREAGPDDIACLVITKEA